MPRGTRGEFYTPRAVIRLMVTVTDPRLGETVLDPATGTGRFLVEALCALGLRHVRTRPYTPRTNGKAERFIQTALREWAYVRPYRSSAQRAGALGPFLADYNVTRPHTAHGRRPPISRLSACEQPLR